LGPVREYLLLADRAVRTMRSDRRDHPPCGVQGGKSGAASRTGPNPGPEQRVLPVLSIENVPLKRGDLSRHVLPGGGGHGDPFERDPRAVLDDVLDENVTVEHARRAHGVVIDPATLTLDPAETRELRARKVAHP
jgi:N-methylhydantoinase B